MRSCLRVISSTLVCLVVLCVSGMSVAREQHQGHYFGVHGMALFTGESKKYLYASHLPLFRAPHDHQLVYVIEMKPKDQALVNNSINNHRLVTFEPDPFDLNKLISGESMIISGSLYQGHFERGGNKLAVKAKLIFKTPAFIRKIEIEPGQTKGFRYASFAYKSDQFILNLIEQRPSFDHILQVNGQISESLLVENLSVDKAISNINAHPQVIQNVYQETLDFQ